MLEKLHHWFFFVGVPHVVISSTAIAVMAFTLWRGDRPARLIASSFIVTALIGVAAPPGDMTLYAKGTAVVVFVRFAFYGWVAFRYRLKWVIACAAIESFHLAAVIAFFADDRVTFQALAILLNCGTWIERVLLMVGTIHAWLRRKRMAVQASPP